MGDPVSLVPKPTVRDRAKQEMLSLLDDWRGRVESGEIEAIFLIANRADNCWLEDQAGHLQSNMQTVGQMEYVKQKFLKKLFEENGD